MKRKALQSEDAFQNLENLAPPQNIEAEEALIGGLLFGGSEAYRDLILPHNLDTDHFYSQAYRLVFEACQHVYVTGEAIDLISVTNWLESQPARSPSKAKNLLEQIGGRTVLANAAGSVVSTVNLDTYTKLIKDKAGRRYLLKMADDLRGFAHSPDDLAQSIGLIQERCLEAMQHFLSVQNHTWSDTLNSLLLDLGRRVEREELRGRLQEENPGELAFFGGSTGLMQLDEHVNGINPGQKIIFFGRSSSGKSTVAQNLAHDLASQGHPVLIIALEGDDLSWARRLASVHTQTPSPEFFNGSLSALQTISSVMDELVDLPIHIDDKSNTPEAIRASALQFAGNHVNSLHHPILIIDHLQHGAPNGFDRKDRIDSLLAVGTDLAEQHGFTSIMLSQSNRESLGRNDKRPQEGDLSGSDGILQVGDIVIGVFYPERQEEATTQIGEIELHIVKNREGQADGVVRLGYEPTRTGSRLFSIASASSRPQLTTSY